MSDGTGTGEGGRGRKATRRTVLKAGGALGAASVVPWTTRRAKAAPVPGELSKFENELPDPLPSDGSFVMTPNQSGKRYDVSMVNTAHDFDPSGINTPAPVFAYRDNNGSDGGTFPGKTFEVWSGESVAVKYTNELFDGHFLPIDTTVHGASDADGDEPRTVTHLHGGKTQPPSDGEPEDTRTPGKPQVMNYSNRNPASTLWYHDHALGITRLNVYAGLAGFYIVRDENEAALGLPSGEYEIPLVLQDRCFDADGRLLYPYEGEDNEGGAIGDENDPRIPLEFFGNVSVVNGVVWPKATVEPTLYRLRLLNGSNSRFYNLKFDGPGGEQPPITQIGTDGGFLFDGPYTFGSDERILVAPGERVDLLVDFGAFGDEDEVLLHNNAGSPFKGSNFVEGGDDALPDVMKFVVAGTSGPDHTVPSSLPTSFPGLEDLTPEDAVHKRHLTLVEGTEEIPEAGETVERLQPNLGVIVPSELATGDAYYRDIAEFEAAGLDWDDPLTEDPRVNEVEVWNVYNLTEDTHPIHLHIVQFKLHARRDLHIQETEAPETRALEIGADGVPVTTDESPPDPIERGPKDTVRVNPGECLSIVVPFDTFPGRTVWHCHILEHEDNEMMRPMKVSGKAQ